MVIDKETELAPFAHDRDRELRLWEATADLLEKAAPSGQLLVDPGPDVRTAAAAAQDLLATGAVRPRRALVANAGWATADTRVASADGLRP